MFSHIQDLAVYKIIGMLSNLEIAEMCARSGANCGSLFLDLRFKELMKTLLADHPVHLDAISLANFMEHFSENEKLRYMGVEDDGERVAYRLAAAMWQSEPLLIRKLQIRCSTLIASTSRIPTIPLSGSLTVK